MRFTVVRSLFKKIKYNNRRKRKRRRRDPRPENYTPSKVGAVFALRCTDENCGNEKNPYTSCLVDERDGNEVFGTVRDAEKHYEKYHAVETAVGDGGSIEDNGIIANAEPPATPQGHGATAPRRSPRNSDLINHVTRPDSTLTRTFIWTMSSARVSCAQCVLKACISRAQLSAPRQRKSGSSKQR